MSSTRCTCTGARARAQNCEFRGTRSFVATWIHYARTTEASKFAICACRSNTPAHTHHQRAGCWRPRRCSWRRPKSESCSRAAALQRRPGRAGKPPRTPTASPQDLGPSPRAVTLGGAARRRDHGHSERRRQIGPGPRAFGAPEAPRIYPSRQPTEPSRDSDSPAAVRVSNQVMSFRRPSGAVPWPGGSDCSAASAHPLVGKGDVGGNRGMGRGVLKRVGEEDGGRVR